MSYRATVYRIMIASPSDVATERRVAAEVIHEWNAVHSTDRRIVLMPAGWETHASPAMGDRPQAVINRQVLQDCDLLVAIFWTRLGSPTGPSVSGTVEEIEEHLSAGKPAMVYFSSAPVHPDSVVDEQYRALREFKEEFRKRGLIEEYESISDFRMKFTRQLALTVIRDFAPVGEIEEDGPEQPVISTPRVPSLSKPAQELLIEASNDKSGSIMCVAVIGGFYVQTNGREFVEQGNSRSEAQWRSAIKELESLRLIEDRGYKGEVFTLTNEGYRVADILR